ncbi:monofunctional biosynthetic peptidoglycan transglycosylase [Tabrizicola caldifontis]|uniref:monofunctional biosynthetic peptidoglycan transglycosylase n=1 Tax=Tabrizicola caldifontis TaxID=2528036 RepID=UPI0010805E79|nr:monofunctional biosynthetic peptidoglycan transglycosylase [Rhodobacter sp. YIM 73028]
MTEDVTEKPAERPKPAPRKRKPGAGTAPERPRPWRRVARWVGRIIGGVAAFYVVLILLFSFVPPPINLYQLSEAWRLGGIEKEWVSWDEIAPVMARSAVAAEDANFCNHWGFDMAELRKAIAAGSNRGASTISQQVVKNVFLWHGRTYARKALEAVLTPVVELVWSKQRILEVYLNVAEFDEGVFGVQAAARHYFGVDAKDLTALQAARLAAILPDPKGRDAANPSNFVRNRTRSIISGAETIRADGRSACFED